jgi:hypothetical protein
MRLYVPSRSLQVKTTQLAYDQRGKRIKLEKQD